MGRSGKFSSVEESINGRWDANVISRLCGLRIQPRGSLYTAGREDVCDECGSVYQLEAVKRVSSSSARADGTPASLCSKAFPFRNKPTRTSSTELPLSLSVLLRNPF